MKFALNKKLGSVNFEELDENDLLFVAGGTGYSVTYTYGTYSGGGSSYYGVGGGGSGVWSGGGSSMPSAPSGGSGGSGGGSASSSDSSSSDSDNSDDLDESDNSDLADTTYEETLTIGHKYAGSFPGADRFYLERVYDGSQPTDSVIIHYIGGNGVELGSPTVREEGGIDGVMVNLSSSSSPVPSGAHS